MDTYKGAAKSQIEIRDKETKGKASRSEKLRYESVVAVNPGEYEVGLVDAAGKVNALAHFNALNRESYVIMRTGIEAKQGPAYPQELVIYPNSPNSAAVVKPWWQFW